MTQDRNGLPTIGQNFTMTRKDEERMLWQQLSNLWNAFAEMLAKVPTPASQEESIRARKKAANYAGKLIDSIESELKK